MTDAMLIATATIFGVAIGSFLNVVVWRVPRGESVVHPPSACPRCGHQIRARDNVPVISWLLLRGRCRDCKDSISPRYPLVEAGCGALFGLAAWFTGPALVLPAILYLVALGIALALIDLDTHRLPDVLVLPSYGIVAALLAVASWNPTGDPGWGALARAAIGAAAMFLVYLAMVLVYPAGMGFGDVKLAGLLGMVLGWYGWPALAVGFFVPFVLGGLFALGLVVLGKATRKSGVPFGPWMVLGAGIGIVVGNGLVQWYLDALGAAA